MRLKECSTNYHASSLRRREARQEKPTDAPRAVRGKKDRKRWCGGHVGREHKPVCMNYGELKPRMVGDKVLLAEWRVLACTVCGKELDLWWPSALNKRDKPAWVTA